MARRGGEFIELGQTLSAILPGGARSDPTSSGLRLHPQLPPAGSAGTSKRFRSFPGLKWGSSPLPHSTFP